MKIFYYLNEDQQRVYCLVVIKSGAVDNRCKAGSCMKNNMDKSLKKAGGQNGQTSSADGSPLTEEVYRAIAMMKRVRKSTNVQLENASEQQQMPSYLIPGEIVLCQSGS